MSKNERLECIEGFIRETRKLAKKYPTNADIELLKKEKFPELRPYLQKTYLSGFSTSPFSVLSTAVNIGNALEKVTDIQLIEVNEVVTDYVLTLPVSRIGLRAIKESLPYVPSKNGTWGINPISFRIVENEQ
jgi:hypothetical protein